MHNETDLIAFTENQRRWATRLASLVAAGLGQSKDAKVLAQKILQASNLE